MVTEGLEQHGAGETNPPATPAVSAKQPKPAKPDKPAKAPKRKREDLRARPFPLLDDDQWRNPQAVLKQMYLDAEAKAIEAYDWYMLDRVRKRIFSRILRAASVVFAAAGGLQPLISVASNRNSLGWGYVLLALAGACVALDHFLGLSTRWMRDMVTAQRIQQRLQTFQYDWAAMNAADAVSDPEDTHPVGDYLEMLREFVTDISSVMAEETSEWVNEFQTGLSQLSSQTPRPTGHP